MKKTEHKQLYITIIFSLIVCGTLYFMYELFYFHTYSQRVYYDALASVENDAFKLENYEIFQDEKAISYGNGTVYIKDVTKVLEELPVTKVGDTLQITILVEFISPSDKKIEVAQEYQMIVEDKGESILSNKEIKNPQELEYASLVKATMKVESNEQEVSYPLQLSNMHMITSSNKESRIETASIRDNVLRLGKLVTRYDLVKEYDNVSLEYRYMKDPKGDTDDIDNYVVFDKVSQTTKEYMKIDNHGTYIYDGKGTLEDKVISVVVILNKDNEEYIFSMDMEVDTSGVQYE